MQTASALLSRRPHTPAPFVSLGDADITLTLGRVHELCGSARRTLALALAAQVGAPVIWITTPKSSETLNPDGMSALISPKDVLFVRADRESSLLWAMEEALRAGCAPVVIGDLGAAPAMTPVRRLHLAAETGCGMGQCRPLALLLTPDNGGAPGIETRWSLQPAHTADGDQWRLERLRARMAPPRTWLLEYRDSGLAPSHPPNSAAASAV
ncbi:ImuA family protein [Marivita sp. S0852]|uniref:ImuA family protein n=1 Tax=Marivita sp. S0852 TaxID=3373893 RepID=UPI003982B127